MIVKQVLNLDFKNIMKLIKYTFIKVILTISVLSLNAQSRVLGNKSYEISNHLGNVMSVVSDRKTPMPETTNTTIAFNETVIKAFNDYYPYGMLLDGRNESKDYRFGFQGQEKDDEVKGENKSVNYKYRVHDPRLGRFFTMDPLASKYPFYSSYQFSGNKTIAFVELEGLEEGKIIDSKEKGSDGDMINVDGNKIDVHLKEFSVSPENEPEREIIRWKVKEKFEYVLDKMSFKNRILNLFKHPSRRRGNVKKVSLGIDSTAVYKPVLIEPRQISKSIDNSSTLSGLSKILDYNSPSDARSPVNYTLNYDGLGSIAPNRFIIRDSNGNLINSGGNLQLDQENNNGTLNFSLPANVNFTIEVQGINNPEANDVYQFNLNYSYTKR